jgi:hypothetical protein
MRVQPIDTALSINYAILRNFIIYSVFTSARDETWKLPSRPEETSLAVLVFAIVLEHRPKRRNTVNF